MENAACQGKGPKAPEEPDPWFPERNQPAVSNEGIAICFSCTVRPQCDEYRKRTDSEYGIWAGKFTPRKQEDDGPV